VPPDTDSSFTGDPAAPRWLVVVALAAAQ
jgi:hypothetical protein